jgi:hypothetical protein
MKNQTGTQRRKNKWEKDKKQMVTRKRQKDQKKDKHG